MKKIFVILFLLCGLSAFSQIKISERSGSPSDFRLCADGQAATVYVSAKDFEVVKKVAALFSEDIQRVTGVKGSVSDVRPKGKSVVVLGTLGHNPFIDGLVEQKKLDVSAIRHGWEQYVIKTIDNPAEG